MEAKRDELTGRWSLSGVEPSGVTFERMCEMLTNGENFKFARYGDGEFNCMSGKVGRNCDKHEYFPDLGTALNRAFYNDPKYMVGIQPLSVHGGLYQKAIIDREGPKNIYDADVLHSASIDGNILSFLKAVATRYSVLVGPQFLADAFGFNQYVVIPDVNCWEEHERIADEILEKGQPDCVVLLCASMMSEVLIDQYRHSEITMIDVGSCLDPYAGKKSRSYHHKLAL